MCSNTGKPKIPIRTMVGHLLLKRIYNSHNVNFHKTYSKALEIISQFENTGKLYSVDQVVQKINGVQLATYIKFTENLVKELKERGNDGNARAYQSNLNIFKEFMGQKI